MVMFPASEHEAQPGEYVEAAAEGAESGMCINYYPGMLFDLYDEDMEYQERLFALQFFGAGEGIEVPGGS